ncbi:helix-turn-helix transcriptional regulator [Lachnospiraceae bacterium 56-18]|mgnify:CR=1 FL=1
MDQIKIGKFIASMRKKQGLSQKQLAERIDVTDKTISKWETGNRMPDASILLKLSSELQINVNELLTGEKFLSEEIPSEEYMARSESNIVNLIGELDENNKKNKGRQIGTVIGILCIALAFAGLIVSSLPVGRIIDIFDMPTMFYLFGSKFLIISFSNRFHDYINAWK